MIKMNNYCIFYIILTIFSLNLLAAQELPDLSKLNVNDLQAQLPAEFANSNFSVEDAKSLLRNKCIEAANGNQEQGLKAYEDFEMGTTELMNCVSSILNYTTLQTEIEEAKPRGDLDVVFNKYCSKRIEALTCVETFNKKLLPCLEEDERENKDVFMRIVTSLLNFVCHKGGDQIALFIAEKGPECLSSKKENIQQCLNDTLSPYLPKDGVNSLKTQKLPKFVMGEKQCGDLEHIEKCIVAHLENCEDITPANIVESMFRFIRNETICRNIPTASAAKQSRANNGTNVLSGSILLLFLARGLIELLARTQLTA